jgi:hypothetical protein
MSSIAEKQKLINFSTLSKTPEFMANFVVIKGRGFCKKCRRLYILRMHMKGLTISDENVDGSYSVKRGDFFSKGSLPEWPKYLKQHLDAPSHERADSILIQLEKEENEDDDENDLAKTKRFTFVFHCVYSLLYISSGK